MKKSVRVENFEEIKTLLPEERKSQIEKKLRNIRQRQKASQKDEDLIKQEQDLQKALDELGGSTRERTMEVMQSYDIENYWYATAFDEFETQLIRTILKTLGRDIGQIQTLDLGCGTGRVSSMAHKAVASMTDQDTARIFARNMHGVDKLPRFVKQTRRKLEGIGVLPANINEADFTDLPEHLQQGDFDITWILMNTLFYCTNEEMLKAVLENIAKSLREGGIFLFDTVKLFHPHKRRGRDNEQEIDGLTHYYDILVRKYQEDNLTSEPVEGKHWCRYPIRDNTSNGGFHNREVISIEYLLYVIRKNNIALKLLEEIPHEKSNDDFEREKSIALGMQWIEQNELTDWLREEIRKKGIVEKDVDEILKKIAIAFVRNYTKQYFMFQKA